MAGAGHSPLRLAHGSCTWPHGSTRINTYAIPADGVNKGKRLFPREVLKTLGRPTYQEASTRGTNGNWAFSDFEALEGTLILVQASTSKNGKTWAQAALVMRLRDGAPLQRIGAKTIVAAGNLQPTVVAVLARADILTPKEANRLGAGLSLDFVRNNMISKSHRATAFEITELVVERESKPKMVTRKVGRKKRTVLEEGRRKRRIKLRRK